MHLQPYVPFVMRQVRRDPCRAGTLPKPRGRAVHTGARGVRVFASQTRTDCHNRACWVGYLEPGRMHTRIVAACPLAAFCGTEAVGGSEPLFIGSHELLSNPSLGVAEVIRTSPVK